MDYIAISEHLAALTDKSTFSTADKTTCLRALISARMLSRGSVEAYADRWDEACCLRRKQTLLRNQGITFPMLDKHIEYLNNVCKKLRSSLVTCGEMVIHLLNSWQECGATLAELCNLCNKNYEKTLEMLLEQDSGDDKPFSWIVFIYNLDYPETGGDTLEFEVDAPLTHVIKEYMLHQMLHDPIGQEASRIAFEETFPEIMEKALYMYTDENGIHYPVDKDGNPVETE